LSLGWLKIIPAAPPNMPLDGEVGISGASGDGSKIDVWVRKEAGTDVYVHYMLNGGDTVLI